MKNFCKDDDDKVLFISFENQNLWQSEGKWRRRRSWGLIFDDDTK